MTDLTKLTAKEFSRRIDNCDWDMEERIENERRLERLAKCEMALRKARTLLISEGNPDEDREMIAEIDELLGDAARAAVDAAKPKLCEFCRGIMAAPYRCECAPQWRRNEAT